MRRWHHSLVPALVYRYRAQTRVLAQIEVPPRTGIPAELPGGLRVPPFRLRFPQSPLQQLPRPFSAACAWAFPRRVQLQSGRSEEHTSELQSLMRLSYAVFCLKKKKTKIS